MRFKSIGKTRITLERSERVKGSALADRGYFSVRRVTRRKTCSGNVQMSVLSNLEMSVSPVVLRAAGGDVGDGAEHERCGAEAARGAAGC